MNTRHWKCRIGPISTQSCINDLSLRNLLQTHLAEHGVTPEFTFSGFAPALEEPWLAVVENRQPKPDWLLYWCRKESSGLMLSILKDVAFEAELSPSLRLRVNAVIDMAENRRMIGKESLAEENINR